MNPHQKQNLNSGYFWWWDPGFLLSFSYCNALPHYFYYEHTFICVCGCILFTSVFIIRKNKNSHSIQEEPDKQQSGNFRWKLKRQTGSQLLCHCRDQNIVCVYSTQFSKHFPSTFSGPAWVRWWGSIDESILFPDLNKLIRKWPGLYRRLYYFAKTAVAKHHRQFICSSFWRLEVQDQGVGQQVWFLLRAHHLTCRWPPSHCALTWSSLCLHTLRVPLCIPISFSHKDTSQTVLGSTLRVAMLTSPPS